ncbi:MAG TPA: type V CRISPR-associated protein Cas12b [Opitutaceae bacterium]|nr:type V CRISPR-associated protein Cas12b [Opitutaceae bacterium]
MNRIYQGRVAAVHVPNPDETARKEVPWVPLDGDPKRARELGDNALWDHHVLFQDAVNYYIVALASLGVSPDRKLTKLATLLQQVWDSADKKGQRRKGLGESLQRTWQLEVPPTFAEAVERFRQPLRDDSVPLSVAETAGEFLLFNLGGEAGIQQGGRVFFPMFCDVEDKSTYRLSATRRERAEAEDRLKRELHRELSAEQIRALSESITLGAVVNLQPGEPPDTGEAAIARVRDAARTFHTEVSEEVLSHWLENLRANFTLPRNRGGNVNTRRLHGCILFLACPNEVTKTLFQSTFAAPKAPKDPEQIRPAEKSEETIDESHFAIDGQDPIQLARGTRGCVFVGFTALPLWSGDGRKLHWKAFDIAAFKEALKVYNQFQQNVEKREAKLDALATKLLVMDGSRAIDAYAADTEQDRALRSRLARIWAETKGKPKLPSAENGEEPVAARFEGDARIDRLRKIVNEDLAEEYRLTDGRKTPYGLRRRTMKGWGEVKRRWQEAVRKGTPFSPEKRRLLQAELDELRGGEKREQIGSHRLFGALIDDEAAWSIWREPDDKLAAQIDRNGWAIDPLEAFREYCETREALEEISDRRLNFTPADARYSRRLFIFTDTCSFGKDRGVYRHDPKEMAVTVPVACRDETGRYSVQPRRLVYSAPRFLRDNIRAVDGNYAQDWTQPMMRALFGANADAPNPQELKDAAVQLMPDFDGKDQRRILLNFPLDLDESRTRAQVGKADLWLSQFHTWKRGNQLPFLRWPSECTGKEPHHWWEKVDHFRVLAADLGTRHAASVALVEAGREQWATARFIGEAGNHRWHARLLSGAILRLPGEDAVVLRPESRLDQDKRGKAFREELHGARGRKAFDHECKTTLDILNELAQLDLLRDATEPGELRRRFSLPEQNDKLLVALRRTQNWVARCISWHWKLTQPDTDEQRGKAIAEIADCERMPGWKAAAADGAANGTQLRDAIRDHIIQQREMVQRRLLDVTRRILPLRGRRWEWVTHPDKADCHLLRQTGRGRDAEHVILAGQRGLSMARIEQLSELRRRWQSLNQSLRRELGQKPLTASEMRSDPIPDPCPDILRKLENIREQRVNQTAHLILVQALGLRLTAPQTSPDTRERRDLHGEYTVARAPVDMIVLEDLSRYLSDQGRPRSENTRLMKWCHRAVVEKVKMLAEPFGIPVLETPAAYSSRFCSLTGIAGFRAAEVRREDKHEFRWRVLLDEAAEMRAAQKEPSGPARFAELLFEDLEKVAASTQPHRTLLAPQPGGPVFVTANPVPHPAPSPSRRDRADGDVLPMQADINAAANLAFRAIAHPGCADLHHRLRTQRKAGSKKSSDTYSTRETRRFGKEGAAIQLRPGDSMPKERNSNLFIDRYSVADFGRARLPDDRPDEFPYASGPGLWKKVNDREFQWRRCAEINRRRLERGDDVPM